MTNDAKQKMVLIVSLVSLLGEEVLVALKKTLIYYIAYTNVVNV